MLKVVSYCMFGKFYETLPTILRAHHSVFPGYELWLQHDPKVTEHPYWKVAERLQGKGLIKLVLVEDQPQYTRAMLWRMMPIWQGTDYVFCRDLDALPIPKERWCMEEFISSGLVAHGINDNVVHSMPLMGGMCGFNSRHFIALTGITSYAELIAGVSDWVVHGTDQELLSRLWHKTLRHYGMIHRVHPGAEVVAQYQEHRITHLRPGPVELKDIDPEVAGQGDKFINYIGAAGVNTPLQEINAFYEAHANDAVRAIMEEEKR